eukprot:1145204-Pelagomonas_calceolata.AAC.1
MLRVLMVGLPSAKGMIALLKDNFAPVPIEYYHSRPTADHNSLMKQSGIKFSAEPSHPLATREEPPAGAPRRIAYRLPFDYEQMRQ